MAPRGPKNVGVRDELKGSHHTGSSWGALAAGCQGHTVGSASTVTRGQGYPTSTKPSEGTATFPCPVQPYLPTESLLALSSLLHDAHSLLQHSCQAPTEGMSWLLMQQGLYPWQYDAPWAHSNPASSVPCPTTPRKVVACISLPSFSHTTA